MHIVRVLNPISQEAEAERAFEYEICLVYKLSSQLANAMQ